ncbi:MAG TPA: RNA-binding S4 domain-containing protein [Prolixibacteraceae bacterium]|nr:RNA-binding S4 domain-containing protein [Prolixibacteraceae bacterium]
MPDSVRIDKWLWAVRLFKTRSKATEACRKGRVEIDGFPVKPSREVRADDVLKVNIAPVARSFKVLAIIEKRVSAKIAPDYVEDITPPEELEVLRVQREMNFMKRERGTGRPTKKERRDLDDFFDF